MDKTDGCWLWTGAKKELGYGVIGLGRRAEGTEKAHRVSYRLYKGEIAEGQCVLHKCDNPSCVNPDHLSVGTLSDNMRDCVRKRRNFVPDNRGEKSTTRKLSKSDVLEIRKREMTGREYAKKYGVSKSTVFAIWRGVNWKYD